MFSAADHQFMARALQLAAHGLLTTSPNPRVGCVLVSPEGHIVGEGWHERAGAEHAEINALHQMQRNKAHAKNCTAYITLEPCNHYGRTPPCVDALITVGIRKVIAAMLDPNPKVAGQGLARLQAAGINTACGLMMAEAQELNLGFISRMERQRPWVRLKTASSLDGRTGLNNGQSQWITSPAAREDTHRWRARACAILSGAGTICHDDPLLNVRHIPVSRQPLRVILDSHFRIPIQARIFEHAEHNVLLVSASDNQSRRQQLQAKGIEVLNLPDSSGGQIDLSALLKILGQRGINELHVEAGATLNGALLEADYVDEWLLYLAPSILGHQAQNLFRLPEFTSLSDAHALQWHDIRQVGHDLRIITRRKPITPIDTSHLARYP